jgi:branched-subunit amino acid transport protein AzlD
MTVAEQVATILLAAAATMATRFLPFVAFGGSRETPAIVTYLGRVLPGAIFAILVAYCLRDVDVAAAPHGAPELVAIAVVVALHLSRRNTLLSIAGGTVTYMLLVQLVFA